MTPISPKATREDLIAMIHHRDELVSDLKSRLETPAPSGAGSGLDCMEYMPLTLKPMADPNHDDGEHWVLDANTAYVFKLGCDRERAERIVASLNAAAALTQPAAPQPSSAENEQAAIDALRAWFKFQSNENANHLYNAAARLFGSDFNPAEYDDVE